MTWRVLIRARIHDVVGACLLSSSGSLYELIQIQLPTHSVLCGMPPLTAAVEVLLSNETSVSCSWGTFEQLF